MKKLTRVDVMLEGECVADDVYFVGNNKGRSGKGNNRKKS